MTPAARVVLLLALYLALSLPPRRLSAGIGMDLTMRFHQLMALAALGFLLLHPFLYGALHAELETLTRAVFAAVIAAQLFAVLVFMVR